MDFIEGEDISNKEVSDNPHQESSVTQKIRSNPWILTTIVLGILSAILIFGSFSSTGAVVSSNGDISKENVGDMLVDFYEAQGIEGLQLISVEDDNGFYKVDLEYLGQTIPFYVTKSGYLTGNAVTSIVPGEYEIIDLGLDEIDGAGSAPSAQVSVDDDAVKGDANAPVTIIEFSDYECPFCERFYSDTLNQIQKEYIDTGKVKLVYRDFPLSFHANAQKAAEAAECAGEFGDDKYYEMHDKLFEEGVSGGVDSYKQYAKDLGLDTTKFNDCLDSGEMEDEVQKDMSEGASYGVSGTPAFFVNGKLLSGAQPFSAFKQVIDAELAA